MKKIGITSTIPVEVIYAAGYVPVDLNNIFIESENPAQLVAKAEYDGYPRNSCGWIKGIYTVAANNDFDAIISVVEGDCSQTNAMVETLQMQGINIIPFAYPFGRDYDILKLQIQKLIETFNTSWDEVAIWKLKLDSIRKKVHMLDKLTWKNNSISSFDNHYYQICCSDFNSDPDKYESDVDAKLAVSIDSSPDDNKLRLGYIGIPPIYTNFYSYLEELGVKIVFNEVQRQFSMPFNTTDITEQYKLYTYPYDVFGRIDDINTEIKKRNIKGLIHYTQSFCFRQIQDMIMRKKINIPILTIEGDAPCNLDGRTKIRIESFVEMLG